MIRSLLTKLQRRTIMAWLCVFPKRIQQMSPEKLKRLYGIGDGLQLEVNLIDIRSPERFAIDHIPGAVNLPLDCLPEGASKLDPVRPTIVYCYKGVSSRVAAKLLTDCGFENVISMMGGWDYWLYWEDATF